MMGSLNKVKIAHGNGPNLGNEEPVVAKGVEAVGGEEIAQGKRTKQGGRGIELVLGKRMSMDKNHWIGWRLQTSM